MNALDSLLTPAAQRRRRRRAHLADQRREADVTTLHELRADSAGSPPDRAVWASGLPHRLEQQLWRAGPAGMTSTELARVTGRPQARVTKALHAHDHDLFVRVSPASGTRPAVWTIRPTTTAKETAT